MDKNKLEKGLGQKTLEGINYVGKNFWKVLPIGSEINWEENYSKRLIKDMHNDTPKFKRGLREVFGYIFHKAYSVAAYSSLAVWAFSTISTGNPNPIQAAKEMTEHEKTSNKFDSLNLFKDTNNFEDSLKIYKKHGLPIILGNPDLKDKEKVLKSLDSLKN